MWGLACGSPASIAQLGAGWAHSSPFAHGLPESVLGLVSAIVAGLLASVDGLNSKGASGGILVDALQSAFPLRSVGW